MRVFRFVLLILGLIALVAGIALVVMPRPVAPHLLSVSPTHEVYLGTETCYVCHPSVRRAPGGDPVSAEGFTGAMHAALVSAPGEGGRQAAGTIAASMSATPNGGRAPASPGQGGRYVLQTERGYAILPGQWGMPDAGDTWLSECAGCHVVDRATGQRLLAGRDFSCETCHGPGGVHVDALVSLPTSRQLRRASAPPVDLSLCRTCHAWAVEGGEE